MSLESSGSLHCGGGCLNDLCVRIEILVDPIHGFFKREFLGGIDKGLDVQVQFYLLSFGPATIASVYRLRQAQL